MKKVTISVPESLKLDSKEATVYLVEKLYEVGKISAEQGAELLGLTRKAFIDLLSSYGLSFEYPKRYPGED